MCSNASLLLDCINRIHHEFFELSEGERSLSMYEDLATMTLIISQDATFEASDYFAMFLKNKFSKDDPIFTKICGVYDDKQPDNSIEYQISILSRESCRRFLENNGEFVYEYEPVENLRSRVINHINCGDWNFQSMLPLEDP